MQSEYLHAQPDQGPSRTNAMRPRPPLASRFIRGEIVTLAPSSGHGHGKPNCIVSSKLPASSRLGRRHGRTFSAPCPQFRSARFGEEPDASLFRSQSLARGSRESGDLAFSVTEEFQFAVAQSPPRLESNCMGDDLITELCPMPTTIPNMFRILSPSILRDSSRKRSRRKSSHARQAQERA